MNSYEHSSDMNAKIDSLDKTQGEYSPFPRSSPRLANIRVAQKPLSIARYLWNVSKDLLGGFESRAFEDLIVERRFLWFSSFLVSDPDAIRRVLVDNAANYVRIDSLQPVLAPLVGNGLVTTEGDIWRAHRRIMAPLFDVKATAGYYDTMLRVIETYLARWMLLPEGSIVDVQTEMMQLTLEIIVSSVCSTEDLHLRNLISQAVATFFPQMKFSVWSIIPGVKSVWATRARRRGKRALIELDRMLYSLISERSRTPENQRPADLLTRLIAESEKNPSLLSCTDIRDQLMTVITAGHETSAMALSWMWYVLSQDDNVRRAVEGEIDSTVSLKAPAYEDLMRLSYTRRVIDEVLRFYPPVHSLGWRQAVGPDCLCGTTIPPGAVITIVPWVIHRHHKLWENPDCFDPDRFLKERQAGGSRYSYIPFSIGPHVCLGGTFAIMEMLLVVTMFVKQFRLALPATSKVQPHGMVTLHSSDGFLMRLHHRGARVFGDLGNTGAS